MHLSRKAYRWWQDATAKHFYGDGYAIDFISRSAIRYREETRKITFSTEPILAGSEKNKPQWVLQVYVHRPLTWDDPGLGAVTDPAEERLILGRVEAGLKSKVGRYDFVADAS